MSDFPSDGAHLLPLINTQPQYLKMCKISSMVSCPHWHKSYLTQPPSRIVACWFCCHSCYLSSARRDSSPGEASLIDLSADIWQRYFLPVLSVIKFRFVCRGHVGGTRFAKRSSRACSDANVRSGHFVELQGGITTLFARWPLRDTFGCSRESGTDSN